MPVTNVALDSNIDLSMQINQNQVFPQEIFE